ncbi:hypothetical protein AMK16_20270 [Streptomyces sp. CB00455]|uniref:patatin-like phospholipase family protein n=1 Tax=Streptomyces sp. CB00455 TaxID=1703927 RepID=UPI000939D292|nr:patatin-like phospholipase family protein [Streptomyces sp. CB00455]OKK17704.1 hypothetical protein AMK16_20270 [Streptomyces sp. CB00455]
MRDDGTTLVLGGGGPLGAAWLAGMLAGLAAAGGRAAEVVASGRLLGTSAGAVLGARLAAGTSAVELYRRQLEGADRIDLTVTARQSAGFLWAALGSRTSQGSARRLGRAALAVRSAPPYAARDAVVGLLGDVRAWPDRPLRVVAVDARTGEPAAFDAASGVTLLDAVAASCAVPVVWPAVTVAGRQWIDGGVRSTTNCALAGGARRVVVLAPVPKPPGPHRTAAEEAAALARGGARVTVISPDRETRRVMGRNMADAARAAATARAAHAQATRHLADVARTADA